MTTTPQYDLAIIGTGAAGFTASIYASRYDLTNIIIGAMMGGQVAEAHLIQNYPPFQNIKGFELITKFKEHAESYKAPIMFDSVKLIEGKSGAFTLTTDSGKTILAKTILLATGMKRRKLNVPCESKLCGKGVSYCATCDGQLYKGKVVAVVGGSDAANTASLYLADIASKVYQIYRGEKLRGELAWANKVASDKRIEVLYNTKITAVNGTDRLTSITLDKPFRNSTTLTLDGLFIEIGSVPDLTLAQQLKLTTDDRGFIIVDEGKKTNFPGIWAAGDSTNGSNHFHQIITAAAEGAIAAEDIFQTLQKG